MPLYLISYDLTKEPESEYEDLIALLKKWNGERILFSEWLVATTDPADTTTSLRDAVQAKLKPKDLLWVIELCNNAAWTGCRSGDCTRAKTMFANYARSCS